MSSSEPLKPSGNLPHDVSQTIMNIGNVPCARNSLMAGIASGVGMGFIRGMSAGVRLGGNWAFGTFAAVSLGCWHLCQHQIAAERKRVQVMVESTARRSIKEKESKTESD